MAASILIVDGSVTGRIVFKVKLLAARYRIGTATSLRDAQEMIAAQRPDMILLSISRDCPEMTEFLRALRRTPVARHIPVIAVGGFSGPEARLDLLQAGADDVLDKPVHEVLLLARIRSLLRMHNAESEIVLRDDTSRALGMADPGASFDAPARIAVIAADSVAGRGRAQLLAEAMPGGAFVLTPEEALGGADPPDRADLFIIDAGCMGGRDPTSGIFRLVPELRSRSGSRHAAQVVILPKGAEGIAAMVLDLGANDIVVHDVGMAELAYRVRGHLRRKHQQDRLRATLRDGLQAAITDPLTGLHNRRYALPHVQRMADEARRAGKPFAVMVLDIDHFKSINDTWGHTAGDKVLAEVARRLRDNVRAEDLVARIGGEEFLVAMPDTSVRLASHAAERLCNLIEEAPFVLPDSDDLLSVTLSIGVAMGDDNGPVEVSRIFDRADAALYAAKTAGRNTVSLSAA